MIISDNIVLAHVRPWRGHYIAENVIRGGPTGAPLLLQYDIHTNTYTDVPRTSVGC